jgi:beta propeller repeat protein
VVDGSYVVWEEQRFSGDMYSDIYGYDLATGTEFPVCTAIGGQHNPAISGNTVVWDDERDGTFNPLYLEYQGNDNIYGFNLKTSSEFPVCLDAGDQTHPSISVSNVVWQWNDGIKGVDLSTSVQFLVVAGSYIYAPAISEARVVWTQQLGGSSHLLGYDLDSATAFSVAASGGQPSISGDCVTWSTGSGSAQGVYGSYLVTGEQFLVSAAAGSQYNDAISGYTVVWQDERNANWDIYGATLTYPDTTRPTTRAYAARGRANGRVALRFRVTDPLPSCGKATVKIQIRKRSKVVRTIRIGTRRVNAKLTYRFKATLKRGQYTWRVLATDVAGHRATRMVSARLVVK